MYCPHYSKKLMVGSPSAAHIVWMYQYYIQTLVRKSTSTTQPSGVEPDNRGHKVNPSVAACSPSVRWGHRKLCPVAKLDNEAGGNRTHTYDVHMLYQTRPLCCPFIVPSTVRVAFSRNRRYSTLRSDEFLIELSRAGIEPAAARGFHIGITLPQLYHH